MLDGITNAALIYNPAAGRRRDRRLAQVTAAQGILRQAGIEAQLEQTRGRGTAAAMAREAVAAGRQMVIACGGDGTINEIVNGMAGSRVPLAVLPAGTANVLAKELGIPWDVPAAARLIPGGALRRIALGRALRAGAEPLERWFVCIGGAGPDGVMVYSLREGLKARTGQAAYWWEGLRQLARYRFPQFRVSAPELDREIEASLVVVGRTAYYGGPFRITTRASLFEDAFEVALVTTRSRWRYLSYLPKVWLGRLRRQRGVFFAKVTSLRCEAIEDARIYAQVDGEPLGRLPVEFRIVPDALSLVVPRRQ